MVSLLGIFDEVKDIFQIIKELPQVIGFYGLCATLVPVWIMIALKYFFIGFIVIGSIKIIITFLT